MTTAFRCRIQYNSDLQKIRKFFEDADTINIGAGEAGLAFYATTSNDACYYMVHIHACDIYQLDVKKEISPTWKYGGVVRAIPAASFNTFIKNKEVDDDIQFTINDTATSLHLAVMDGMNEVRSVEIPLTIPMNIHDYPSLTNANVVIKVNEFKKLCSDMAKISTEIKIESQDNAIRFKCNDSQCISYGKWDPSATTHECYVKNTAFSKATKINIGNTKNSNSGIYVYPEYPVMIKVKLNVVDFIIYSKKWIDTK